VNIDMLAFRIVWHNAIHCIQLGVGLLHQLASFLSCFGGLLLFVVATGCRSHRSSSAVYFHTTDVNSRL